MCALCCALLIQHIGRGWQTRQGCQQRTCMHEAIAFPHLGHSQLLKPCQAPEIKQAVWVHWAEGRRELKTPETKGAEGTQGQLGECSLPCCCQ